MRSCYLLVISLLLGITGCWWFHKPPPEPTPPPIDKDMGLQELKQHLYSEDAEYRALAADSLVVRGDKRAMRLLSEALREAKDEVVFSILKVLTKRYDERYIQVLIDVLERRNPAFHPLIFDVFRRYQQDNLTDALLSRAADRGKPIQAKQYIIQAVGKLRSKKAVEPLINLLGTEDGKLDQEIVEALEEITKNRLTTKDDWQEWWGIYKNKPREVWLDEAVAKYQKLLAEKNLQIDNLTAGLVNLKIELLNIRLEQVRKLSPNEGIIPTLLTACKDEYWPVRKYAVEQLRLLPKDNLKDVVPKIAEMINDPQEELRNTVVLTLGDIGDENQVSLLGNIITNQKETLTVRRNTALALGRIGSTKSTPYLVQILPESSIPLVSSALESLGKIKDKSVTPTLVSLLADKGKPPEIHRAVVDALGEIRDPSTVEILLKFAEHSQDRFRWSAANALGKIGNETALPNLIKLLEDNFADVRQISAEALGNIGSEAAVQPLLKVLLNDKDPRVRELSALALGKIRSKKSVAGLINALDDTQERVVNATWNTIWLIVSGDINLMQETAQQLESGRHYTQSAEIYQKMIELSNKTEYLEALIRCYNELNKVDEVVKCYSKILGREVVNSTNWWQWKMKLVNFLYNKKEYAKCLTEIKELLGNGSITPSIKEQLAGIKTDCENKMKE